MCMRERERKREKVCLSVILYRKKAENCKKKKMTDEEMKISRVLFVLELVNFPM